MSISGEDGEAADWAGVVLHAKRANFFWMFKKNYNIIRMFCIKLKWLKNTKPDGYNKCINYISKLLPDIILVDHQL